MKITDELIKKSCSSTIYKRGIEYWREGRVHLRKRSENLINAVVDGEQLYNVQVKFDENKVHDSFCTCPYYETMGTVCKHIVATLKQRQTELDEGADFTDDNDIIAAKLCNEYAAFTSSKEPMYVRFILYVESAADEPVYSVSLEVGTNSVLLHGIENFLDCYLNGREFKIDRQLSYIPSQTYFPSAQKEIIDILAEAYEMHSVNNGMYTKSVYRTSFGEKTAKRIFPLLKDVDFQLVFDGMTLNDVQIMEENPDIIVDIDAAEDSISLSVSEYGFSLSRDGSWFLFENIIYHTNSEWRRYFMPVYRALAHENRTHISFKGDNVIMFAAKVLPNLKGKHGVITRGLDELIVNEKPVFKVYLDCEMNRLSAVVTVSYGSLTMRIGEDFEHQRQIVIRDYAAEREMLESFEKFSLINDTFFMYDDSDIYDFITFELPLISLKAQIYTSQNVEKLKINEDINIKAFANYNTDIDFLEVTFETDLSHEQLLGMINAIKLGRAFYRMENGRYYDLVNNKGKDVLALFERLDFTEEELAKGKKELPKYRALYLDALGSVEKERSFVEYIDKIKGIEPIIPKELEGILRPYQYEGIKWLKQLSSLGFGGILADDMGLGKTLQVLAFVHGERPKSPVMVVTPSALMYNWLNEIERFIPDASVLIIDGLKDERKKLIDKINDYEFVITSYPILRRDISLYSDTTFEYLFIDEAQHIKNYKTMSARSVKKVSAKHKFALTGTPIENSLSELWSVFDFVMSGYLYGINEFRTRYEQPVLKGMDATVGEDLKMRIHPLVLRRMKKDVLHELPEKIENTMYAELSTDQKTMYMSYLAVAREETAHLLEMGGNKIKILSLLMRLRQICCHPLLIDETYAKESGKCEMLLELVSNAVDSGHRILVFSQFTSMLAIIRKKLDELGISSFYLDGKTPPYERAELSDRFNGGERDVFLVSLKAGGTGLNLTGADTVIHYDPWWNPAVTDQASDRAYRIGQTRAVQVIRLAAKGTIEEKILKLQERKRLLADDFIKVNHETLADLSNDEIIALFE